MNQSSDSSNDVLKVGAISFAGTLEPTENYFSWAVVRYGVGETLIKFDDHMNAKPWLASSWKQSDDCLLYTSSQKACSKCMVAYTVLNLG